MTASRMARISAGWKLHRPVLIPWLAILAFYIVLAAVFGWVLMHQIWIAALAILAWAGVWVLFMGLMALISMVGERLMPMPERKAEDALQEEMRQDRYSDKQWTQDDSGNWHPPA